MIVKTSTQPVVAATLSAFYQDVARIALAGRKSTETSAQRMTALVTSRYGDVAPIFADYKADLKALDALAKAKGLESSQWLRRPYCAALKTLYKELPVSQALEAVAKRAQREAMQAQVKAALSAAGKASVGAPKGETQERMPSEGEQLEQLIARVGVFEALYACLRILDVEPATHAQVTHMRKMADKAKDAQQAADKAAREAAIKPATV